ncbi:hypothetical protein VCHA53O466_140140 [Vibrio chagasii]|nr:hypothetical protein VCHA53O466_140140 [Vibrio chagasii]
MQSIVNQYVASKLAKDLLNVCPSIILEWCKECGLNALPDPDRRFHLMLISRLEHHSEKLLHHGECEIGSIKYRYCDNTVRNASAGNHLVVTTDDLTEAEMLIETKCFVNRVAGIQYSHKKDKVNLLNEIVNDPDKFNKNWRRNNFMQGKPKMQFDLNNTPTGWHYVELANSLLDDTSISMSGFLFNDSHAFKIRSDNKVGFTASLVAHATAIDLMRCKTVQF